MLTQKDKYSMDIKDISKTIKNKLNKSFPGCKFSAQIERYAGGQSLTVRLMAAPFNPLVEGYDDFKGFTVNHHCIDESKKLTSEAKVIFLWIKELVDYFNYDNSDRMTDYFDVNFYYHLEIGKWDKPFAQTH